MLSLLCRIPSNCNSLRFHSSWTFAASLPPLCQIEACNPCYKKKTKKKLGDAVTLHRTQNTVDMCNTCFGGITGWYFRNNGPLEQQVFFGGTTGCQQTGFLSNGTLKGYWGSRIMGFRNNGQSPKRTHDCNVTYIQA